MRSRIVIFREVTDHVYHLQFSGNGYLMCASLLRFQEHYECPKFKDKIFTLEQYMDYYAGMFGNFTYYQDIGGFNIPSYVLKKFYAGQFDPLTEKEKGILKIFAEIRGSYYIIATAQESNDLTNDFVHELAHALFYVNEDYHKAVRRILRGVDLNPIYVYLQKERYHRSHFLDEAQALLLEDAKPFFRTKVRASVYVKERRQLREEFNRYFQLKKARSKRFRI